MSHSRKEIFLKKKVIPFDAKKVRNIDDILTLVKNCGFQGRKLGLASDILYKMVSDKEILTVLTLAGAMVPAGYGKLISILIEYDLVDVLISTGANITHDLIDAVCNIGHYIGG